MALRLVLVSDQAYICVVSIYENVHKFGEQRNINCILSCAFKFFNNATNFFTCVFVYNAYIVH
jgi:hypothetical protein